MKQIKGLVDGREGGMVNFMEILYGERQNLLVF